MLGQRVEWWDREWSGGTVGCVWEARLLNINAFLLGKVSYRVSILNYVTVFSAHF